MQTASQTLQSSPFQGDLSSFHMLQLDNEDQFKLPQSGTAGMSSNLRRARSKSLSDELNAMLASQFQHRHAQGGGAPAGQNLGSGWLGESISAVGENLIPTEAMPLNKSLAGGILEEYKHILKFSEPQSQSEGSAIAWVFKRSLQPIFHKLDARK